MFGRRPAETRKIIQGLIILTLLAWATHTLVSQWGFAADIERADSPVLSEEKFLPSVSFAAVAVVELRSDATIAGAEIRLKQIARWSDADAAAMRQNADLIVSRFERNQTARTIDIETLKSTLEDAGVNLALINFQGAISCKVARSDTRLDAELAQAITAAQVSRPTTRPMAIGMPQFMPPQQVQTEVPSKSVRSLRDILVADLVDRLNVPAESLQIRFSNADDKLVSLAEPLFQFDVEPQKLRRLGDITWSVTICAADAKQKVLITANVRMWQNQVTTARPLAYKQIIHDDDLTDRRILVDRLSDDVTLTKEQVVGQQAGRDLGPGAVLTGRMIEAVQLARIGQLITVAVELGRVHVIWVGEARETGCLGQSIRVRKPGTREEFSVVLTGPQQAKLIGPPGEQSVARLAVAP